MFSKKEEDYYKEKAKKEFKENQFKNWESKAKEYLNDKTKAFSLLKDAQNKADDTRKGPIGEIWDKLQLLISIFQDWIYGNYKEIPTGSIIMIIIGLVYFVVPVDIIPDWIIGLGFLDDVTVLGLIIKQINSDLEEYRKWKQI